MVATRRGDMVELQQEVVRDHVTHCSCSVCVLAKGFVLKVQKAIAVDHVHLLWDPRGLSNWCTVLASAPVVTPDGAPTLVVLGEDPESIMPSRSKAYVDRAFDKVEALFGKSVAKSITKSILANHHFTFDSTGSLIVVGKPLDKFTKVAVPAVSVQGAKRSRQALLVCFGIASKLTACRVTGTGRLTVEDTSFYCKFGDSQAVRQKDVAVKMEAALKDSTRLVVEEMDGEEIWKAGGFSVIILEGQKCLVTKRRNLFRLLPAFNLESHSDMLDICLPQIDSLEQHMIQLPGLHIFCLPDGVSTLTLCVVFD